MFDSIRHLLGKTYFPLNTIELSRSALEHNYQYLSRLSQGIAVAPVLKSNAYGHGLVEVAKILDPLGAPFFCVDSLFEAYALLKAGINTKILIMGYVHPGSLKVKRVPFSFAVFTPEMLVAVKQYQPEAGVHIFVDTGMRREGVPMEELPGFVDQAVKLGLKIEGLMSHLAEGDAPKNMESIRQNENFKRAQMVLADKGIHPEYLHLGATAGLFHATGYSGIGNLARVGIGVYGIDPEGRHPELRPVLTLNTTIAQIKAIPKGAKVGYDFTFSAKKAMKLAVLPIGYNDGVDRRLSNQGAVEVEGKLCPVVGRVSMNITLVDVSGVEKVQAGDRAVVYGSEAEKKNSIAGSASLCGAIPYELLVHLNPSIHRNIVP